MPLTPREIEQMTFTASFRGYAEDEVDVFLEEVIISISEYQQMIRDRDAKLARRGETPAPMPQDVPGANEEANRILQAAKRQAEQILADARARALEIESNVATVGAVLSPDQEAERERLIAGYDRLRSELSVVKTRVQKALSASQEAFGIMEGQVASIIEGATPAEAPPVVETPAEAPAAVGTPAPEPAPVAESPIQEEAPPPVAEVTEPDPVPDIPPAPEAAVTPVDDSLPAESPDGSTDSDDERPRRPWER